jgi:Fur family ferric uptake transcriptional regulator
VTRKTTKAHENREALRERLRGAGLKVTGPRVLVFESLLAQSAPASHADVAEALAAEGLDRTTVYRNLIDLAEAGLATRHDFGDHVWRFEARRADAPEQPGHPHFTCTDCGQVACLDGVKVELKAARGKAPAPMELSEVQLRGRCSDCRH